MTAPYWRPWELLILVPGLALIAAGWHKIRQGTEVRRRGKRAAVLNEVAPTVLGPRFGSDLKSAVDDAQRKRKFREQVEKRRKEHRGAELFPAKRERENAQDA